MLARCDEEIEMIKPTDLHESKAETCVQCGNPYTRGVDAFCKNCGSKLE